MSDKKEKPKCYVCNKSVGAGDYVCITNDTYRHKKCAVGSPNWLKSEAAKDSEFYGMFQEQIEESKNKTNGKKPKKTIVDEWIENNRRLKKSREQNK